jgi:hypothetical protein
LPALPRQVFKSQLAQAGLEVVCLEADNHQLVNLAFIHTHTNTVCTDPGIGLAGVVPTVGEYLKGLACRMQERPPAGFVPQNVAAYFIIVFILCR